MKVGFIGLGKLGLPVALAVEYAGHEVSGCDINPAVRETLESKSLPYKEEIAPQLLHHHNIAWRSVQQMVEDCDLIFLPVQTPHDPKFEGDKRIPKGRADFDYSYLVSAVREVAEHAEECERKITLVVISTCLPGTYEARIKPLLNDYVDYVYNPFFIAMGTVIRDFTNPEFVLIGQDSPDAVAKLQDFYSSIHPRPCFVTDITTAEGIKVFYNTFITMKTVLANIYGEMSHKLGMNVDHVSDALALATDRIVSPRYLRAGMGDGGGCHPRDNIALSYIAENLGLSHNIFEDLMAAREHHAEWQASLIEQAWRRRLLPIVILGRAFKPETNIETGSPAVLVSNILTERALPHIHVEDDPALLPAIYFLGTQHERYKRYSFPEGSVVIDPFGYIQDAEGVEVIRIGRP